MSSMWRERMMRVKSSPGSPWRHGLPLSIAAAPAHERDDARGDGRESISQESVRVKA